MKKTLYFVSFLFLLSSLFAQENNQKVNEKKNSDKTSSVNATGDEINFKDDANNSLIKITDEGSAGSITIPPGTAPSVITNKLYNESGTLKFNGSAFGGGASDLNSLSDAKYDGESLFLGSGAGNADDGGNFNTSIGKSSLSLNTSGANNTATGYQALRVNTTGNDNTASGTNALNNNTTGSFNTAYGAFTLPFNTTGRHNTAIGSAALLNNSTGLENTANGASALLSNTTGNYNTAVGAYSLITNTTGTFNTAMGIYALALGNGMTRCTAIGAYALYSTIAGYNTATGYNALKNNTHGDENTANGIETLYSNSTGNSNTAIGYQSLYFNSTGNENNASGYRALYKNTTGNYNTANGNNTLYSNTTGNLNTASGYYALYTNTIGYENTAIGSNSLYYNIDGIYNVAVGVNAQQFNTIGNFNSAVGHQALAHGHGDYNTAVGYNAGPQEPIPYGYYNNTTLIGNSAVPTSNNQVRLGNISVTSIGGYATWSDLSDGRFKRNIKENISGIDFIMGLRPVSFNMDYNAVSDKLGENRKFDKKDIKGTNGLASAPSEAELKAETYMKEVRDKKSTIRQVGFIAQEVEELVNKLGVDFSGVEKPENENDMYRLRYSEFVVPLVKAVQEQQIIIQNLTKRIDDLESRK